MFSQLPCLGVVDLKLAGQPLGLGRLERLVQRRGRVGVEIVLQRLLRVSTVRLSVSVTILTWSRPWRRRC
jgi:hypothetical protein